MLAVGLSADTGETVTVNNALETPTFRGTDNVNVSDASFLNVSHGDDVTEFQIFPIVGREFGQLFLGSGSCLFEVPLERLAGVLFCGFVIGKLYSGITIFLYCTELRNNARTSLDNSAWQILTLGTENGSHSDFFSN